MTAEVDFPLANPGFAPSGWVTTDDLDGTFTAALNTLYGMINPQAQQLVTNTVNLAQGDNLIGTGYQGDDFSAGTATQASGLITVKVPGLYRWSASVRVPASASKVKVGIVARVGANDVGIGANDVLTDSDFPLRRAAGGDIACTGVTTFQLNLNASAALNNVSIFDFTVRKVI